MKADYFVKKLLGMLLTVFTVSMLTFAGFDLIKSDAATLLTGTHGTAEEKEQLRERLGLNKPLLVRYGSYMSGVLHGDFGSSYIYNEPVADMIRGKLIITATMAVMGMGFIIIISFVMSTVSILLKGSVIESLIITVNQLVMSVPEFFMGFIIILVFGFAFRFFVPGGFVSFEENPAAFFNYMIFPSVTLALPKCAMLTKLLTNSLNDELNSPYVRTAVSRGNSRLRLLVCHVLKNALLPIITFMGMTLSNLVASSIVVEQVFGIAGIGRLLISGISNRDYPIVQAIIIIVAVVVVLINWTVDITYSILDPRVKVE